MGSNRYVSERTYLIIYCLEPFGGAGDTKCVLAQYTDGFRIECGYFISRRCAAVVFACAPALSCQRFVAIFHS